MDKETSKALLDDAVARAKIAMEGYKAREANRRERLENPVYNKGMTLLVKRA